MRSANSARPAVPTRPRRAAGADSLWGFIAEVPPAAVPILLGHFVPRTGAGVRVLIACLALASSAGPAGAFVEAFRICTRHQVDRLNVGLAGHVLDYTANHGTDRRIDSHALGKPRDVYMYLPPGYDGRTPLPAMIWMHGFGQDEKKFLDLIPHFDAEIRAGHLPPILICCPDGTVRGRPTPLTNGSFYTNSNAGNFEDFVIDDVWAFVCRNFAVRPEREAHVLAGGSMGGYAAYHLGFKNRNTFGILIGIIPPLDIRYVDCHDKYFSKYDPACNAYRETLQPSRVIGRFYGVIAVREKRLTSPTVGRRNPQGMQIYARVNPVEMLDAYDIRPGEFAMFVGIAGRDEFNLDAQAEHFLDVAARRGIRPEVYRLPDGRHNTATGIRMIPTVSHWLAKLLRPYSPSCGDCTRLLCDRPLTVPASPATTLLGTLAERK